MVRMALLSFFMLSTLDSIRQVYRLYCSNGCQLAFSLPNKSNLAFSIKSNQIKSNQTLIYIAPYIASESEPLGLGLDRIG